MSTCTPTLDIWPIGTDSRVVLRALRDDSGTIVAAASVTGQMRDEAGATVGASITFSPAAIAGDYEAVLPNTLALTAGATYSLDIVAQHNGRRTLIRLTRQAAHLTV